MGVVVFPAPILIGSYLVSLFRFTYLKNMEFFQRKIVKSQRLQRYFITTNVSVVCSTILTITCLLICVAPIIASSVAILFSNENVPQEMFVIMFAFEIVFMLLFALVFFIVDLASKGFKIIKRKGLSYYFFFDDPFYYRIDLLLMISLMVVIIPIIVGSISDSTPFFVVRKVFSVMFFILFYFIIGGTVTFAHWFNKLRGFCTKRNHNSELTTEIESLLQDNEFREMFRSYSKNEFSIENILLFEDLEKLKQSNKCSEQDLKSIREKFLLSSSAHEVNFPSIVKKEYDKLFEKINEGETCSNDGESTMSIQSISTSNSSKQSIKGVSAKKKNPIVISVLDLLKPDLLKNMMDTFSRLENTPEFKNWRTFKKIQTVELGEESNIV